MGGSYPDWYPTLVAAREVQCQPWELSGELSVHPTPLVYYWYTRILLAKNAENDAARQSVKETSDLANDPDAVQDQFGVARRLK